MTAIEKHSSTFIGRQRVSIAVAILLDQSQWFQVEPWPDDHWRVSVKVENKGLLQRIQSAAQDMTLTPAATSDNEGSDDDKGD